jgi:protein-tyrosine phosphatase
MGNICRSPMAEGIFRDMVDKAGLSDRFMIDSAGTGAWYLGEPAHQGTRDVLHKHGIQYVGSARQITRQDLNTFKYVLVMDRENLSIVWRLVQGSTAQVELFLSAAYHDGLVKIDEVPDPYEDGRFERTYDLVRTGCEVLLERLRAVHNL